MYPNANGSSGLLLLSLSSFSHLYLSVGDWCFSFPWDCLASGCSVGCWGHLESLCPRGGWGQSSLWLSAPLDALFLPGSCTAVFVPLCFPCCILNVAAAWLWLLETALLVCACTDYGGKKTFRMYQTGSRFTKAETILKSMLEKETNTHCELVLTWSFPSLPKCRVAPISTAWIAFWSPHSAETFGFRKEKTEKPCWFLTQILLHLFSYKNLSFCPYSSELQLHSGLWAEPTLMGNIGSSGLPEWCLPNTSPVWGCRYKTGIEMFGWAQNKAIKIAQVMLGEGVWTRFAQP